MPHANPKHRKLSRACVIGSEIKAQAAVKQGTRSLERDLEIKCSKAISRALAFQCRELQRVDVRPLPFSLATTRLVSLDGAENPISGVPVFECVHFVFSRAD